MSITAISTDWGIDPRIIRITTTDNLATITTAGYLNTPAVLAAISSIQHVQDGQFQWLPGDYVLIYYSNGEGFFTVDTTVNFTFVAAPLVPGSLSNTLANGDIFVGSAGNIATGVAMSGDVHIINTGATTIQPGVVTSAKINATVRQFLAVPIALADFIGSYSAPVEIIAPIAASIILIDEWALEWKFGSAALVGGGATSLQYDNTIHGGGIQASNSIAAVDLTGLAATSTEYSAGGLLAMSANTAVINKGIYLSNPTADFTVGTGGSAVVYVWYKVIAP